MSYKILGNPSADEPAFGVELEFSPPCSHAMRQYKSPISDFYWEQYQKDRNKHHLSLLAKYGFKSPEEANSAAREICRKSGVVHPDQGSDGGGIEIRLQPMTLSYMKENIKEFDFMDKLLKIECKGDDNQSGMHVHVHRDWLTPIQVMNALNLINKNFTFFSHLSNRKTRGKAYVGVAKEYMDNIVNYVTGDYTVIGGRLIFGTVALNQEFKTIEFRMFQGTLSKTRFFMNIEMLQSLLEYARMTAKADITLDGYIFYVRSNESRFDHLAKWIRRYYTEQYYAEQIIDEIIPTKIKVKASISRKPAVRRKATV